MKRVSSICAALLLSAALGVAGENAETPAAPADGEAKSVLIHEQAFAAPNKGFFIWCAKDLKATASVVDGRVEVRIGEKTAEKISEYDIQFWAPRKEGFEAGKTYRLTYTLKADIDADLRAVVNINRKPWTGVSSQTVKLEAGKDKEVTMTFTTKETVEGSVRIPNLAMGKVPTGATISIGNVKLYEVQ